MRYKVNIGGTPAGLVARATPKGADLQRIVAALYTSYDGNMYFKALAGLDVYLGPFYKQHGFSSLIDRCLVVVDKNGDANVYINRDLPLMVKIIPRRQFKVGDPVGLAEIAGVAEMRCEGIDIPRTSGVVLFLSAGWRRGIFFDYRPLQDEPFELPDPSRTFGQIYEYLVFEDLFAIPVDVRAQLNDAGWFPFVALIGGTFEELPSFLEIGALRAWEEKQIEEFPDLTVREMLERWSANQHLAAHISVLEAGVERFLAGDYVSAVNNVWPRVEGILRTLYGAGGRAGQNKLTSNLRDMLAGKPDLPSMRRPHLSTADVAANAASVVFCALSDWSKIDVVDRASIRTLW